MRIDLRNERRQRQFVVHVDLDAPPVIVRPPQGKGPAVHLDWDRALDDEHHLRRCPVCRCPDLFARKRTPQVTGFVLILLAAVVVMVLLGIGEVRLALLMMLLLLAVDVMIFLFAGRVLVCYRCRSQFSGIPVSRRHPTWRNSVAERYPRPPAAAAGAAPGGRPSAETEHEAEETVSR